MIPYRHAFQSMPTLKPGFWLLHPQLCVLWPSITAADFLVFFLDAMYLSHRLTPVCIHHLGKKNFVCAASWQWPGASSGGAELVHEAAAVLSFVAAGAGGGVCPWV